MDETIIEYIYWNKDKYLRRGIGEGVAHSTSWGENDISGWDVVSSKNYDFFYKDSFVDDYGDKARPLKLEYTIKYDNSGNPYNNLNVSNTFDISKNIYIFKPNDTFDDRNLFDTSHLVKDPETSDISFVNFSSNISEITLNIEDKFIDVIQFDISENINYSNQENSQNFILRPGKWSFIYDASGDSMNQIIKKKHIPWIFISTIKIPHLDFLYDNKKVNMELNNITFDKIFLTINNLDLIEMRSHFSKYFTTLGKNNLNSQNQDYMRIFFEFLLWTPNNINSGSIIDDTGWYLPDYYGGIYDKRIQETPTFYTDISSGENTLYEDYYNNEPGLRYDRVSYKSRVFYANHIARIQSNKFIYSYGARTFPDSTLSKPLIIGLSPTNNITKYTYTPNAWTGDIEINASIYKTGNNDQGFLFTEDSTLHEGNTSIYEALIQPYYRISWYGPYGLRLFNYNGSSLTYSNYVEANQINYTYNLKITKNNGKIKVFLDNIEMEELDVPDWNKFYIWVGAGSGANDDSALFNSISITSISPDLSANNVKDISDNIFQINDLSKNFMNGVTQDISFVNITQVVDEASGTLKLIDDGTPIDNWEAVLICPGGLVLQDGSRNILSSYADSNNHSGFSLGIVGNGLYNADNPNESYIFKDVCGNIFPNANNTIDLMEYGVEFDISGTGTDQFSFVKEPFNIRYKIRKNTEKTEPPNHDVYIFINDNFVTKIADNGCKLNDIKYWGTPYDPDNPYKERDILINNNLTLNGGMVQRESEWNATFALNKNTGDGNFGFSFAMTDNWAIVGAYGAKKAFIFKNTAGTWGTTAAFTLAREDYLFGLSVAMTDNWAIVGAYGAKKAFIFKNTAGTWGTDAAFELNQNTGDGNFGLSVAMTDNWAIVGATSANKAFIFKNDGDSWNTDAAFALEQNTDDGEFGWSVAMTDNWAIVGDRGTKKAFIFQYNSYAITYPIIPRGSTTILQSLKVNYIEDIYRPFGLPDSSFINTILYNDNQYCDISGISLPDPILIDLSYNLHEHKQSTVTTNNSFTDISVNGINNYPCTISYYMNKDTNITPRYGKDVKSDYHDDMIVLDNDAGGDPRDPSGNKRILKNPSLWEDSYEQIKPLNYSYIFDAGAEKNIVLEIEDFQFYHTGAELFDRLEIVAGDMDSNGDIIWEKLKNNDKSIIWMHNLQDTVYWKDSTPISDVDLKKNTQIYNNYPYITTAAQMEEEELSWPTRRFENNYQKVGNQYRWQPPPTADIYYHYSITTTPTGGSGWWTWGDRGYVSSSHYYYDKPFHPGWEWWKENNNPGFLHFLYTKEYPWQYKSYTFWKDFAKPKYLEGATDKVAAAANILTKFDQWFSLYKTRRWPYWWSRVNYLPSWRGPYKILPDVERDEDSGDPLYDANENIQYTTNQYGLLISEGWGFTPHPYDWYYNPCYFYYYNLQAKEIKKKIDLIKKTYETHNYNPIEGKLKKIDGYGDTVNDNTEPNNGWGLGINLGIRDFRNNTDISMKFNRNGSPYVSGIDGTDQYGRVIANKRVDETNIKFNSVDFNGSILPKNKSRAINLLNYYNNKDYNPGGTGVITKENDPKIWKIYTKKRFVRLNYFALKSSTNCKFVIKIDRTLSNNEIAALRNSWEKTQKIIFKQKNRGLMPVLLSEAYNSDLSNNQIESIVNEIISSNLGLTTMPNSNYYVNNNNEIPYISLYNYSIRDQTNDIILSSRIKKTILDDTNSYKYNDNRNLRELNLYSNPRLDTPSAIYDLSSNPINKIKQKYNYNIKLFNQPRDQTLPYIPQQITTTFIRSSSVLQFLFLNSEKIRLKTNLINYWLGDVHKTYVKLYLYIWEPYSNYLNFNGEININDYLKNLLKDKIARKINFDDLSIVDSSYNVILYSNNGSDNISVNEHTNQFDKLLEITFDINSYFYGINSIGFPEKNFEYKLTQFKGKYIFCWSYHVFQPDGIYNDLSPLNKLIIVNSGDDYTVNAQLFDTIKFTKDDYIYDPNYPELSWNQDETAFNVSLGDDEKTEFKKYLTLLQKEFKSILNSTLDISFVEISFFIWTPNNCKYDKIFGEDISSNNTNGWILPDDYYGIQDPRILFTPYKTETLSWNPSFFSYSQDVSGTTHYGYNFDLSGVIKKTFKFSKKGDSFNIEDCTSDISFNDLSFNITKDDISFNSNDIKYGVDINKVPNTLEYLKIDNTTTVEYSVPYISRWSHTVYDNSGQKIESRVIKLSGAFGNETSFNIKFKLDPNYYYELRRNGMEGATSFRRLLQQKKTDGLTLGHKDGLNYLFIKVDDIIYQLHIEEPPTNYAFFQLDESGNDIVDSNGEPIKIIDNTVKNLDPNSITTGIKIGSVLPNEVFLNYTTEETKYILYIRPSTAKEKVFLNSLNKHQIVKMETEEIRNRFSNWEPMIHVKPKNTKDLDSNNYYKSDNQYKYSCLFSTSIEKEIEVVVEEAGIKIDPCNLCRPINHLPKNGNISSKLKYANRERQSGSQASRFTSICNNDAGRAEELALFRLRENSQ